MSPAAIVLAATLALVACGGAHHETSGSTSPTDPTLTDIVFLIGQSNAVLLAASPAGLTDTLKATGRSVVFSSVTHGGTDIAQWQKGTSFGNEMRSALSALQTQVGPNHTQRLSVVWIQGESDAANSTLANAYEAALRTFLGDLSTDWPTADFFCVRLHTACTQPFAATVRTAQNTVCGEDADYHDVSPDSVADYDGLHYGTAGIQALGQVVATDVIASQ